MQALRKRAAQMMRNRVNAVDPKLRDLSHYLIESNIPIEDLELDALVAIQGGSDNTSTTMTLAFYYMLSSQYPYYKMLQKELDAAFPDPNGVLDFDSLLALPLLNAVIHEALRLGSPYYLPRDIPEGGANINGNFIPEGVTVAIAAYSQQVSSENFYPDPLEFRPERWITGDLGLGFKTDQTALFSFSSGPHMCIAKALAYQEMRYCITRLVLAFDLELPKGFDSKAYRDGILNMRTTLLNEALPVTAVRRAGVHIPKPEDA